MESSTLIILWIWVAVECILLIIFINLTYSYWSLAHNLCAPISNREPLPVQIISVIILITAICEPFFLLGEFEIIGNDGTFAIELYRAFGYPTRIISLFLLLYREWITYFNIKFQQAIDDKDWRSDINPNEQNLFLKYKSSLGHKTRMLYVTLLISIPLATLNVTLRWIYGAYKARALTVFVFFTPIIASMILWCKFPAFDDMFGVRDEVRMAALSNSVILVLMAILRPIVTAIIHHDPPLIFELSTNFLAFSLLVALQMSLIYYPLKKNNLPIHIISTLKYLQEESVPQQDDDEDDENDHKLDMDPDDDNECNISLKDVLEHENGFDLFARHLCYEFCVETLLFFVETQQFIGYLISENYVQDSVSSISTTITTPQQDGTVSATNSPTNSLSNTSDANTDFNYRYDEFKNIKFPKSAPKSIIIDDKLNGDPIKQCVDLYNKYIIDSGPIPINISGIMKEEIKNKIKNINNLNHNELLHLWDPSRYQMYDYLESSFERFQRSTQFKQHQQHFQQ